MVLLAAFINVVVYWATLQVLSPSCVPATANLSQMRNLVQKLWIVAGLLAMIATV